MKNVRATDVLNLGKKLYSQSNEELIIRSFFQDRTAGVFLDVGCAWPRKDSTTYFLERHLGWSGIAIDANPAYADNWQRFRPRTYLRTAIATDHDGTEQPFYAAGGVGSTQKERKVMGKIIKGAEISAPTTTLTRLLDDRGIKKIDFLSMDIEESESRALAGFDISRFQPDFVCIEWWRSHPQAYAILKYFESHQYELIRKYLPLDKVNRYFKRKDYDKDTDRLKETKVTPLSGSASTTVDASAIVPVFRKKRSL